MDKEKSIEKLKKHFSDLEYQDNIINLLSWDMRDRTPRDGIAYRTEMLKYMEGEKNRLMSDESVAEAADSLLCVGGLDDITEAQAKQAKREYGRRTSVPAELWSEYASVNALSEMAWQEAKEKSDFSIFLPHLEKQISYKKEIARCWGYKDDPYTGLLDDHEPGITSAQVDALFSDLRSGVCGILAELKSCGIEPDTSIFNGHFAKARQKAFIAEMLKRIGYDFNKGLCSESMHPYTIILGSGDVRQTTCYYEDDIRRAVISSIHEGGHTINAQNMPSRFVHTSFTIGPSASVNESQSRFYENTLGRSREFWSYMLPLFKEHFPEFSGCSADEFYRAINAVRPCPVRLGADELTYNLHIIIRYEIEKAIFNESVKAAELPDMWKAKYAEYLGVCPSNDSEGILSDWHWAVGLFGYFPGYSLANVYDGMLLQRMEKDIDVYALTEKGNFATILEWLKTHIYAYGATVPPQQLIESVTGMQLSAKPYIEHLHKRYRDVYKIR